MDLKGIENTRITRLFAASRPQGQLYLPHAATAFIGRYRFAGYPTKIEELSADRVSFKHGLFEDVAIESVDIYGDGIVVASKAPSELLDAFLNDLSGWMESALGLKKIETHAINRTYESYVVVQSAAPLLKTLDALSSIGTAVGQALKQSNGVDAPFQPVALALSPDLTELTAMKPIPFRVERRSGLAFNTNFYYSCAPLPTAEHIKILERLEKLSA
jgi:hypothetical protein